MADEPAGREAGGAGVVSIGCGSAHSLALLRTPRGPIVVSFGRGEDGQLGQGDAEERLHPTAVLSLQGRGVTSVHCGAEYSVAVASGAQQVYSWGWGDFGRLGQGTCDDVFIPAPIAGMAGRAVVSVACGDTHTLVATGEGEVYSFGRNVSGQLGLGTTADSLVPRRVEALAGKKVVGVACGAEHSVGVTGEGEVFAWGWGVYYCIGDGSNVNRLVPTLVRGLVGVHVSKVACGWRHSIAINDKGAIWTWGWGKYSQLGHGDSQDQPLPKLVEALEHVEVTLVTGGWRHSLAADAEGRLYSWGWNRFGQLGLGNNEDANTPQLVPLPEGEQVEQCVSGWKHTVVVAQSGKVYSWGRGGPLGLADAEDVNSPHEVVSLSQGTVDVHALLQGAQPQAAHVPASDRYAVVPDGENGAGGGGTHAVPEAKRQRT